MPQQMPQSTVAPRRHLRTRDATVALALLACQVIAANGFVTPLGTRFACPTRNHDQTAMVPNKNEEGDENMFGSGISFLGNSGRPLSNTGKAQSFGTQLRELRSSFAKAAEEGFGTKARNVGSTMTIGDVVVPLCSNLEKRQILANQGVYPGVEYEVVQMTGAMARVKPAYPLRKHLEREDWPVEISVNDVPIWLSKATYEAGTALGTLALAFSYLTMASFLAFFVRLAYVPSESMSPALKPGDVALVTRSIQLGPLKPRVGDVVFFDPPPELDRAIANSKVGQAPPTKGKQFLKRVAAVPGENVGVKDSEPFAVRDHTIRLDKVGPYARPDLFPSECWSRPAEPLGSNAFFVAGDNGARSVDSRVWGPLQGKNIFGVARWIVYPPQDFGPIRPGQFVEVNGF